MTITFLTMTVLSSSCLFLFIDGNLLKALAYAYIDLEALASCEWILTVARAAMTAGFSGSFSVRDSNATAIAFGLGITISVLAGL